MAKNNHIPKGSGVPCLTVWRDGSFVHHGLLDAEIAARCEPDAVILTVNLEALDRVEFPDLQQSIAIHERILGEVGDEPDFALVPRKPTIEMIAAWHRQKNCGTLDVEAPKDETQMSDFDAYRAMLAAAPTAPTLIEAATAEQGEAGREEIARIIDPAAWASNDFSLEQAGVRSRHHDTRIAPSLAKADAILALRPSASTGGEYNVHSYLRHVANPEAPRFAVERGDKPVAWCKTAKDAKLVSASLNRALTPSPAVPEVERLRDIEALVAACEREFTSDATETDGDPENGPWRDPDDEAVSHGLAEDGHTIVPGGITFGHIRRARKALSVVPEVAK